MPCGAGRTRTRRPSARQRFAAESRGLRARRVTVGGDRNGDDVRRELERHETGRGQRRPSWTAGRIHDAEGGLDAFGDRELAVGFTKPYSAAACPAEHQLALAAERRVGLAVGCEKRQVNAEEGAIDGADAGDDGRQHLPGRPVLELGQEPQRRRQRTPDRARAEILFADCLRDRRRRRPDLESAFAHAARVVAFMIIPRLGLRDRPMRLAGNVFARLDEGDAERVLDHGDDVAGDAGRPAQEDLLRLG